MTTVVLELELASDQYEQLVDAAVLRQVTVEKVAQVAVTEWLEREDPTQTNQSAANGEPQLEIIHLQGLLKGYEFSPEDIAEARRAMWSKFGERDV